MDLPIPTRFDASPARILFTEYVPTSFIAVKIRVLKMFRHTPVNRADHPTERTVKISLTAGTGMITQVGQQVVERDFRGKTKAGFDVEMVLPIDRSEVNFAIQAEVLPVDDSNEVFEAQLLGFEFVARDFGVKAVSLQKEEPVA